jgi:NADH dehydrogenase
MSVISILGGSGFVGTHLVNRLNAGGHRIRVLTRRRERCKHLLVIPRAEFFELDIHDRNSLSEALAGSDVVVNLVGILNEAGHHGRGFQRPHVELPESIVSCCQRLGIRRLLHVSALRADPERAPSFYLRSKGAGEALVHAAGSAEFRVTSFRPSVVFGPGDDFFNRFARLLRLLPGPFPLACGEARFAPVYVEDVVEAIGRCIALPASYGQRYELCGPLSYTLAELVQYCAATLGMKRHIIPLPDWLSRLQASVMEYVPGKPFSLDNYRSLQVDSLCGPGRDLSHLGIRPTPLEGVVPTYLGALNRRHRYPRLRNAADRL